MFSLGLSRLVETGNLKEKGPLVLKPDHQIRFTKVQEDAIQRLMSEFERSPYSPPSIKEARKIVGDEVYNTLIDLGLLQQVSEEVVFKKEDYDRMVAEIRGLLQKNHTLSAAQVRDHFNTSRRYALALLEHLDATGVTVREGDFRKLRQ